MPVPASGLVSFHPSHEGRLHAFRPHLRFGSRHPYRGGASLSRLFIPSGNYRGFCFLGRFHHAFTFLGPFAPPALPGFTATMDPLTPSRLSSPLRDLHLRHAPFRSFRLHPHSHRPVSSVGSPRTVTDSPLTRQTSPLPSRLARCARRIEFTFVSDQPSASGCSPPRVAATQLPSAAPGSLPARG